MSVTFNRIWIFAEILLFVLVGAEVNIYVAINAGKIGAIILFIGLLGRSIGVMISLLGTNLNWKERMFCVISYMPKATVQAAIGGDSPVTRCTIRRYNFSYGSTFYTYYSTLRSHRNKLFSRKIIGRID